MRRIAKPCAGWVAALGLLLLATPGCVTRTTVVPLTGDVMVDGPRMIASSPPGDRVLWQYRTAAAAMRRGQYDYARQLLDDALLTVGGVSTDRSARLARSYFHPESAKNFIGEPYERVMAYYYRGVLYWMDGEPDNARACFRSAAIQDADAENKEYAADYVLLDYLDGLATVKLSGDGSDQYKRARDEARIFRPPSYDPKANVLFFVECGAGPTKYATGQYHDELRFQLPFSPAYSARIRVDGQEAQAEPYDDLFFQATTRGGRVMDHVLRNKAVFKSATATAGNVAILGGVVAATQRDHTTQDVGLGLIAAGLVSEIVSASTHPAADIRSWDNLPHYLTYADLRLPPGPHVAVIQFQDQSGRTLPEFTKTFTVNVPPDGRDKVVFVSDQSLTPQTI
jgi:hypothetical protein